MQGQTTLEFIIGIVLSFIILTCFLQTAVNYTSGFLVHYSTFMASRTYLVMDNASGQATEQFASNEAKKLFRSFKTKSFFVNDGNLTISNYSTFREKRHQKLYVGASFTFFQKLFPFSFLGDLNTLTMVSESFLGKEPTRFNCYVRICEVLSINGHGDACSGSDTHATLFDNGC